MTRTRWTDELIASEATRIAKAIGHMPSNRDLQDMNRCDLANAISKRGGFREWAQRIGVKPKRSDSDFGWQGERFVAKALGRQGYAIEKPEGVKSPFDLLVNDIVRVDVKTANYTSYGAGGGWYYRIGKYPQADIIAFCQLDRGNVFYVPWWLCPRTNVTLRDGTTRFDTFKNNYDFIGEMVAQRSREMNAYKAS